jgi:hypothetical protein
MALRLNGSSSGYVELDVPAAAGSHTLTLPNSGGSSGQYLQTNGSGGLSWQTVTDTTTSVAVLTDVKTQGTAGGTFTSGAWRTRDLNTEAYDPDGIVTLSSNQFTLGAGTYLIHWECPVYNVRRHQSRLYDVTGTAEVEQGLSNFAWEGDNGANTSPGTAVVSPTANNTYEIQHRSELTGTSNGFGVEANFSTERYTRVTIWKVA